jgi:hypothetical protein
MKLNEPKPSRPAGHPAIMQVQELGETQIDKGVKR